MGRAGTDRPALVPLRDILSFDHLRKIANDAQERPQIRDAANLILRELGQEAPR